MHVACTMAAMILFFLLTPGILVSLPSNGTLRQKALVHALVFGIVFHFMHMVMVSYYVY